MKAFMKFPMLVLFCFSALGTTLSTTAIAGSGSAGGADGEPSSTIGVIFVPTQAVGAIVRAIQSSPQIAAAILDSLAVFVVSISGGGPLTSIGGLIVVLPAESADLIVEVINSVTRIVDSGEPGQTLAAKTLNQLKQDNSSNLQLALVQQIAGELSEFDVEMDVSTLVKSITGLCNSPELLPVATEAMNDLVTSASRKELEALANSPSITAIRQVLNAGNSAL